MRRFTSLMLFVLAISLCVAGKPRTSAEALQIAKAFVCTQQKLQSHAIMLQPAMAFTPKGIISSNQTEKNVAVYVYNIGNNDGFVIISGDDCAKAVLGYADKGSLNTTDLSPELKYWLEEYQRQIEFAQAHGVQTHTSASHFKSETSYPTSITPLLKGIMWSQSLPYYNLCPMDASGKRSVTGCIATAMAQVMKYWEWPEKGKGSNSYYCKGTKSTIKATFEGETYDWKNMLDTYANGGSTPRQDSAVAKLMFHCGVATNMNYTSGGSGTQSINQAQALIDNFSYNPNLQLRPRENYSASEWSDVIKNELVAGRPVLYSGYTTQVGHAFVCDGYDANGLFHINWGWNGTSNGYFELAALDPEVLGTGGGSVTGFQFYQSAITGIAPLGKQQIEATYEISCPYDLDSEKKDLQAEETNKLSAYYINNDGLNNFKGEIGFGLFDSEKGFIKELFLLNVSIPVGQYVNTLEGNITIPTSIKDGTYYIYPIYKATEQTAFSRIHGSKGKSYYLIMQVAKGTITISKDAKANPILTLLSCEVTGDSIYRNTTSAFTLTMKNEGADYNSYFAVVLTNKKDQSTSYIAGSGIQAIASGKTETFNISEDNIDAPEGEYTARAYYDSNNNYSGVSSIASLTAIGNSFDVTIKAYKKANLLLTETPSFPNTSSVKKTEVQLNPVKIINNGGPFMGKVVAMVFKNKGDNYLGYFGNKSIYLGGGIQSALNFKGNLSSLDDGDYYVGIYQQINDNYGLIPSQSKEISNIVKFTLTSSTGLQNTTAGRLLLYPSETTDMIHVQATTSIHNIKVWNANGNEVISVQPEKSETQHINVSQLPSGIYIIKCTTDEGTITGKFVKL